MSGNKGYRARLRLRRIKRRIEMKKQKWVEGKPLNFFENLWDTIVNLFR